MSQETNNPSFMRFEGVFLYENEANGKKYFLYLKHIIVDLLRDVSWSNSLVTVST